MKKTNNFNQLVEKILHRLDELLKQNIGQFIMLVESVDQLYFDKVEYYRPEKKAGDIINNLYLGVIKNNPLNLNLSAGMVTFHVDRYAFNGRDFDSRLDGCYPVELDITLSGDFALTRLLLALKELPEFADLLKNFEVAESVTKKFLLLLGNQAVYQFFREKVLGREPYDLYEMARVLKRRIKDFPELKLAVKDHRQKYLACLKEWGEKPDISKVREMFIKIQLHNAADLGLNNHPLVKRLAKKYQVEL